MTYTKKYFMINSLIRNGWKKADNFIIIFSEWDGYPMDNPYNFPVCKVAKTTREYFELAEKYKGHCRLCGIVSHSGNVDSFVKGNCTQCFIHHCLNDGYGGCFDMVPGLVVIMLAH